MKLIYIAGPYRAVNEWSVEQNIRRAEMYAVEVATLGGMPVVPHSMTRFWGSSCGTDQFWLKGTMRLVEACDAMVLIPGWEQSTGSRGEKARFEEMGRADRIFSLGEMYYDADGITRVQGYERLRDFIQSFG